MLDTLYKFFSWTVEDSNTFMVDESIRKGTFDTRKYWFLSLGTWMGSALGAFGVAVLIIAVLELWNLLSGALIAIFQAPGTYLTALLVVGVPTTAVHLFRYVMFRYMCHRKGDV